VLGRRSRAARLSGDELLVDADGIATRAITIAAPSAAVWPWLVGRRQPGVDVRPRAARRHDASDQSQPLRLPTLKDRLGMIPLEPGSIVIERKMLLGSKQRAEQLDAERQESPAGAEGLEPPTYGFGDRRSTN
jgi:hypothetical protein